MRRLFKNNIFLCYGITVIPKRGLRRSHGVVRQENVLRLDALSPCDVGVANRIGPNAAQVLLLSYLSYQIICLRKYFAVLSSCRR